jgi:hypothetical protein
MDFLGPGNCRTAVQVEHQGVLYFLYILYLIPPGYLAVQMAPAVQMARQLQGQGMGQQVVLKHKTLAHHLRLLGQRQQPQTFPLQSHSLVLSLATSQQQETEMFLATSQQQQQHIGVLKIRGTMEPLVVVLTQQYKATQGVPHVLHHSQVHLAVAGEVAYAMATCAQMLQ